MLILNIYMVEVQEEDVILSTLYTGVLPKILSGPLLVALSALVLR